MSMKKAFDQTIRDIKREVNKKVLKVPSIEQKVLDATSNEPWGPHGTLLADIALATRNYHEYQMIMSVIWKRINDTGKNWRHVYKALTVLEYLVAHGSERVIDEIKEHSYQISTLSHFQYIDSGGRDQGNNVRRKSQSLVLLVNDKERIVEVREKAAVNREKFRSSSAAGYRPGYDDRYGGREDDRNGYGREREWGNRDDDRYGRHGDPYNREGDRYSRDSDERYGRDSYRDDGSRGRSPNIDDYQYGTRGKSADRDRERSYDDDDHHSSRGSSVKAEDHPQDGRRHERKFSEPNVGAPPSYEEAVGGSRSPVYSERDGEAPTASAPKTSSPPPSASPIQNTAHAGGSWSPVNPEAQTIDEFDPRGSFSAAPVTSAGPTTAAASVAPAAPVASSNAEIDLLGSLSDSFASNTLAVVPVTSATVADDIGSSNVADMNSVTFSANQGFDDPFGDTPFKATTTDDIPAQTQNFASASVFQSAMASMEQTQPAAPNVSIVSNVEFADTISGLTYNTSEIPSSQNSHGTQQPPSFQTDDILVGILPPSEASSQMASQPAFHSAAGQPAQPTYANASNYMPHSGPAAAGISPTSSIQLGNSFPHSVFGSAVGSDGNHQVPTGTVPQQNNEFLGGSSSQAGETVTLQSQSGPTTSADALALVPLEPQRPAKEKFEPKSAVWADTLNRGLVNFNISGAKVNPLSDIGIDFESLNRKEKRMEKQTAAAPTTSNIPMGKAMGSSSGVGRGGVGGVRAPSNPGMGSGIGMGGMGMGRGASVSMGVGGYGGTNQPMSMGMAPVGYGGMNQSTGMGMAPGGYGGMNQSTGIGAGGYGGKNQSTGMGAGCYGGMNQSMGMGAGGYGGMNQSMGMGPNMGMGMGQGAPMQSASGFPPAANMPSGYNPMMGRGGYPQQPYGGGYR